MKLTNKKVAKNIARIVYAPSLTEDAFSIQLFIEEACQVGHSYSEEDMYEYIMNFLHKNNIKIKAEF
jgi:hypothetical protein